MLSISIIVQMTEHNEQEVVQISLLGADLLLVTQPGGRRACEE